MSGTSRLVAIFLAAFAITVGVQACDRTDCPPNHPPREGRYLVVEATADELLGGTLVVAVEPGHEGRRRLPLAWDEPSGRQSTVTWVYP